jgi:Skp family chaperone for outer membrane proteins
MSMQWMNQRGLRSIGGLVAVCALALGAGMVGARSAGANRSPAAAPPIVAVVDLETVINNLTEQKDMQAQFDATAKAEDARLKAMGDELEQKQKELQGLVGANLVEAKTKLRDAVFKAEFEKQLARRNLNARKAEMLRTLYVKVDKAAEMLAKKNGYDMVLVSDEKAPIPEEDGEAAYRAILFKRMLYVGTTLDISQELLQTINNEYAK